MRSEVKVFALIAIGEIPAAERAKLDVSEFFGFEDDLTALKADPKSAVAAIVKREWPDIEWDGVSSLRMAVIERFKAICRRERGEAHLYLSERQAEAAQKILQNHRVNGGISKSVVERAEKVLAEHGKMMSSESTESIHE